MTPGELWVKIWKQRISTRPSETAIVLSEHTPDVVVCAGSREGGGHPRVFLTVSVDDEVVCPYCSRT